MTVKRKGAGSPDHNPELSLKSLKVPASITLLYKTMDAIAFLIDEGGFWVGTKEQFAQRMGWLRKDGEPDRRLVEDVCTLTREQEQKEKWIQERLAGFVIAYSPTQGGMTLIDPDSAEMPLNAYVHILAGDMARQQQHQTENRRRLPTWKKAGQVAANGGDQELARLCWQAENEIDRTGFVTGTTIGELFKVFASRELIALN